jgi:hypothetical protein
MAAIDLVSDSSSNVYSGGLFTVVSETMVQNYPSKTAITMSGRRSVVQFPVYGEGPSASLPHQKYSKEYETLYNENPWVMEFYASAKALDSVSKLLPYYKNINEMLVGKNYKACNTFLQYVNVENISDVLLVGLLRLTRSWANELPQWNVLLSQCSLEIANRGENPEKLLKGLVIQNGNSFAS